MIYQEQLLRTSKLDLITNTWLRSVRTVVETPVREDSKGVGLHNKGSRTLIQKSRKQLNATKDELSIKTDSRGVVQYNDGTLE